MLDVINKQVFTLKKVMNCADRMISYILGVSKTKRYVDFLILFSSKKAGMVSKYVLVNRITLALSRSHVLDLARKFENVVCIDPKSSIFTL